MTSKTKNFIITGLNVLTFIASGISAYFGIKDVVRNSSAPSTEVPPLASDPGQVSPPPPEEPFIDNSNSDVIVGESELSQKGQRIIGILGVISSVCLGLFEVVKSLSGVTDSVDRLFRKNQYATVGRRGYIPGNYPWNTPEQGGYPNNAPIYRGQDSKQGDIYWIQREEGITEVW